MTFLEAAPYRACASRRRRIVCLHWMPVAIAVVLIISALSTTAAQAQGRGEPPPPYRPAAGAKDLRSVLFNWTWYMGMLRGVDEHELIVSLEYQGKGTIQVDGQPCTLTKYRVSTNYQMPGQRVQYTCTRPNGQTYSGIEVVSGQYAWNEDIAGAEIIAGKGKATPMPGAVQERLIRLWAGPQGAPKAAIAGAAETTELGPNPGTLVKDGVEASGKTTLSWDAGKPVVTFPIPGVPGATATATLNAKYMVERLVVRQGSTTTEFTYSDYADWNNPLNKVEVFYAGKMGERRNGAVVRDLTTTETETGSVYVVMPVPASVKAAIAERKRDTTWLARGGFFHSDQMRVVEKLTRQGNEITYEVTVEDPEVFVEPWVMTPRTLRLNPNPEAGLLPERGNCEVYELENITSQIRH